MFGGVLTSFFARNVLFLLKYEKDIADMLVVIFLSVQIEIILRPIQCVTNDKIILSLKYLILKQNKTFFYKNVTPIDFSVISKAAFLGIAIYFVLPSMSPFLTE